jgi:DnaJ homolog subfamily B member 13
MAKNYYQILDLKRDCSDLEIINAYKKLSIRYHQKNTKEDKIVASHIFNEIAEAYEVLSDYRKRSCYDQVGEFGLKQGGVDGKGGYRYLNNAEEIFQKFFEADEPLEEMFGMAAINGSLFGKALRGMSRKPEPKPKDLEIKVPCTLEELYNGCNKTIVYSRTVIGDDRVTSSAKDESKSIDIKKGFRSGHRLVFNSEGHMSILYPPSDLVFIIHELPNSQFKRNGDDLIHTQQISLLESFLALPIQVRTLDYRVITVSFQEIIAPDTVKVIKNEGMPIYKAENQIQSQDKGDLHIKFDILFPKHISEENKRKAIEILS